MVKASEWVVARRPFDVRRLVEGCKGLRNVSASEAQKRTLTGGRGGEVGREGPVRVVSQT